MTPPVASVEGWTFVRDRSGVLVAKLGDGKAVRLAEIQPSGRLLLHNVESLPRFVVLTLLRDAIARGVLSHAELTEEREP